MFAGGSLSSELLRVGPRACCLQIHLGLPPPPGPLPRALLLPPCFLLWYKAAVYMR